MLTPEYLRIRSWVSQAVLVVGMLYLFVGFAQAQSYSQDYINATNTAEINNLKAKIDSIDNRMWYLLAGVFTSLIVHLLNIRNAVKNGNGK